MNPQDHLHAAVYRFTEKEITEMTREWIFRKTGRKDITFDFGIDDEDQQARISFWENEENDELWNIIAEKIPHFDDDYFIPVLVIREYIHATVIDVKAYYQYSQQCYMYYVEIAPDNYIHHDSLHEWGFV